jgi:hypothetical protein
MQRPVDHGMMDRAAHFLLLGGLYRGHHQHASRLGLFEKRSEQSLFLLDRQVLAMTSALGLTPESHLTPAEIARLHLPYRTRLPTQGRGNLRRTKSESGSPPDTLDALVLCFAFRLQKQHR